VYDSLIIRYNATTTTATKTGAGQPFHRDLGLCSMNIALNSPSFDSNKKMLQMMRNLSLVAERFLKT
jgi:hypothetical protein